MPWYPGHLTTYDNFWVDYDAVCEGEQLGKIKYNKSIIRNPNLFDKFLKILNGPYECYC